MVLLSLTVTVVALWWLCGVVRLRGEWLVRLENRNKHLKSLNDQYSRKPKTATPEKEEVEQEEEEEEQQQEEEVEQEEQT